MNRDEADSSQAEDEACIFCFIANGQDKEAQVMKKVGSFKTNVKIGKLVSDSRSLHRLQQQYKQLNLPYKT